MEFEWDTTDRFRSNNGAGPYTARITHSINDRVYLERWLTKRGERDRKKFSLSIRFFQSKRCGWKKKE